MSYFCENSSPQLIQKVSTQSSIERDAIEHHKLNLFVFVQKKTILTRNKST